MKIGGFGELENLRKAIQKDDKAAEKKEAPAKSAGGTSSVARGDDAAEISPEARKMAQKKRMLYKLDKVPDIRRAKLERIIREINDGRLMTPEVVKESIAEMVKGIIV